MLTKGMQQQLEALQHMNGREYFALFMEMGTGKTYCLLADAERQYAAGAIEGVLVVAPKGVHSNWVRREIPTHLSAPHCAAIYHSEPNRKQRVALDALMKPRAHGEQPLLRILAINIDAVNTPKGFDACRRFLNAVRGCMMIVDESDRIKNPDAKRTQKVIALGQHAKVRRIASGAPLDKPLDLFSQMEFLQSGLLGTTSYRSFVSEYAELLSQDNPLVKEIVARSRATNPWAKPQIVAKDSRGNPKWRNLDKLRAKIAPHSFRKMKAECLDLPEKIYQAWPFQLAPKQRIVYQTLHSVKRLLLEDGTVKAVDKLAALTKLQQVTSGFVNVEGEPQLIAGAENPRMAALEECIEGLHGKQFIVWARYREELVQIAAMLKSKGITFCEYHGDVSETEREEAVDGFQAGRYTAFIGIAQAGGIGLTLTAAEAMIYYSNDFSLLNRQQSEDRAHRIGQTRHVVYVDLIAEGTIDEWIVNTLKRKEEIAHLIMGDEARFLSRATGTEDN